ncbi:MAG TPA: hypothetical protein VJJ22_04905 [Candidatus Paceibacterota bacterium]
MKSNKALLTVESLRKVIRDEVIKGVKHLATQKSVDDLGETVNGLKGTVNGLEETVSGLVTLVDNLAISTARGFEETATKEDMKKLESKVDALIDAPLRDLKRRVTILENRPLVSH